MNAISHPVREAGSRSPKPVDIAVGERVRELRTEMNLTLSEMGERLGISHQQLQKYETGANRLSAGMLWDVAQVFGIEVSELFGSVAGRKRAERVLTPGMRRQLETMQRDIAALLSVGAAP